MSRSPRVATSALQDAVAGFRAKIARLALDASLDLVHAELVARRSVERARVVVAPTKDRGSAGAVARARSRPAVRDSLEQPVKAASLLPLAPVEIPPPTPAATDTTGTPTTTKRRTWSRDEIVAFLVQSIVGGTMLDAAFLKRHAPPGFVTSTMRQFGRLDAALNLAAMQVAKLYPRGRPEKRLAALRFRR